MPPSSRYLLISLPASIAPSQDKEDALNALKSTVSPDSAYPFAIPAFKIGTLDALVQQADDLGKLDASCEAVVSKVADSLKGILDGDEHKLAQQKTINDSRSISTAVSLKIQMKLKKLFRTVLTRMIEPVDQYLRSFQWNKVKYRADKPIAELIDGLQKVGPSP
jgi:V-type H+-transporting ATPase subunit C